MGVNEVAPPPVRRPHHVRHADHVRSDRRPARSRHSPSGSCDVARCRPGLSPGTPSPPGGADPAPANRRPRHAIAGSFRERSRPPPAGAMAPITHRVRDQDQSHRAASAAIARCASAASPDPDLPTSSGKAPGTRPAEASARSPAGPPDSQTRGPMEKLSTISISMARHQQPLQDSRRPARIGAGEADSAALPGSPPAQRNRNSRPPRCRAVRQQRAPSPGRASPIGRRTAPETQAGRQIERDHGRRATTSSASNFAREDLPGAQRQRSRWPDNRLQARKQRLPLDGRQQSDCRHHQVISHSSSARMPAGTAREPAGRKSKHISPSAAR